MSPFTRAFRSFRAMTFFVGLPAHKKIAPSSGPVIAQIPDSNEEDRTTNAMSNQTSEEYDTDAFSEWWTERFNDPKHTEGQLGKYRASQSVVLPIKSSSRVVRYVSTNIENDLPFA